MNEKSTATVCDTVEVEMIPSPGFGKGTVGNAFNIRFFRAFFPRYSSSRFKNAFVFVSTAEDSSDIV